MAGWKAGRSRCPKLKQYVKEAQGTITERSQPGQLTSLFLFQQAATTGVEGCDYKWSQMKHHERVCAEVGRGALTFHVFSLMKESCLPLLQCWCPFNLAALMTLPKDISLA